MTCCFLMYPMFYSSLFGRFLLLQVGWAALGGHAA